MIMLCQCTEVSCPWCLQADLTSIVSQVIEWCNDWYVWQRWQSASAGSSRANNAPRRYTPGMDILTIQEAYEQRASCRADSVEGLLLPDLLTASIKGSAPQISGGVC